VHDRPCGRAGATIIVRYADDFVMGFQHRDEAERFLKDLRERLAKFGLGLHPDKTRLIEFGRFAAENRARRGESKPETFNFLGFTHICGKKQWSGGFIVKRQTTAKRLRAKLREVRAALMRSNPSTRSVPARSGSGLPELPRRPSQHGCLGGVPNTGGTPLALRLAATEPPAPHVVGTILQDC
jgi:hypothetical protein